MFRKLFRRGKRGALAFVLGGGGARGALEVGAIKAFLEQGIVPDMVVGTSAGAANAVFLALYPELERLSLLEKAWSEASETDLLPSNLLKITLYAFLNRTRKWTNKKLESFFASHLPDKNLRFGDIKKVKVFVIAADINSGEMIVFGDSPDDRIIDALLASTAIPPWIRPLEKDGQFLIDGGIVSNLPIEPAISRGAGKIVAFDISEKRIIEPEVVGFGPFFSKLLHTVSQRQLYLEMAVAEAKKIPLHRIKLRTEPPVPIWDFTHTEDLIEKGYKITKEYIEAMESSTKIS